MSKSIKKVVSFAAPIVGSFFGPVGTVIGGAIGGAMNGGLKGALMGGVTAGLGSMAGSAIGGMGSAASVGGQGAAGVAGTVGTVGQAMPGHIVRSSVNGMAQGGIGGLISRIPTGTLLNAASGLVGNMNEEAAEEAAKRQRQGIQAGINANTAAMAPYTALGRDATQRIGEIQADPSAYIQGNPLYNSLAADAERRLMANQASKGKVGSGGTAAALQEQLLNLGTGLVNTEIGNLQSQAGLGAGAAGQVGSTAYQGNVGMGDANAAGVIGANNAMTSSYQNQLNTILAMQGLNSKQPTGGMPINL